MRHTKLSRWSGARRGQLGEEGTQRVIGNLAPDDEPLLVQIAVCDYAQMHR